MPRFLIQRFFFDPDTGGGGGGMGGDDVSSAAAAMAGGPPAGADRVGAGGDGTAAGATPATTAPARPDFLIEGFNTPEEQARAYHQMAQRYGGHGNVQQYLGSYQQILQKAQHDPSFLQDLQALVERQQQPQGPQTPEEIAFLDYDDDTLYAFRELFENKLTREDPRYAQVSPKYDQHGKFMTNFWLQPHEGLAKLFQHPVVQQAMLNIVNPQLQQQVQPIQQTIEQQQRQAFFEKHQADLDNMLPEVAEDLEAGVWGRGPKAILAAIGVSNKIRAKYNIGGGQPPAAPQQTQQRQQTNGRPAAPQTPRQEDVEGDVRSWGRRMAGVG